MSDVLQQEWLLLQQQVEQQERQALTVKLTALALVAVALFTEEPMLAVLFALLCWGQEAMLRTWQARLVQRLQQIEQGLAGKAAVAPMQLHTEFVRNRARGGALLREYAGAAIRPTVMYPYVLLALAPLLMRVLA